MTSWSALVPRKRLVSRKTEHLIKVETFSPTPDFQEGEGAGG